MRDQRNQSPVKAPAYGPTLTVLGLCVYTATCIFTGTSNPLSSRAREEAAERREIRQEEYAQVLDERAKMEEESLRVSRKVDSINDYMREIGQSFENQRKLARSLGYAGDFYEGASRTELHAMDGKVKGSSLENIDRISSGGLLIVRGASPHGPDCKCPFDNYKLQVSESRLDKVLAEGL